MKKAVALIMIALTIGAHSPVFADVQTVREGEEAPFISVAKSTGYGFLGGLVLGMAIALLFNDSNKSGDIFRWSLVAGTFAGFGFGIYHVATRPGSDGKTSLLQFHGTELTEVNLILPKFRVNQESVKSLQVPVLGVHF